MSGRFVCEKSYKQLYLESFSALSRERQKKVWVNSMCCVAHAALWCNMQESWGNTGPIEFIVQYLRFKSLEVSSMFVCLFVCCSC